MIFESITIVQLLMSAYNKIKRHFYKAYYSAVRSLLKQHTFGVIQIKQSGYAQNLKQQIENSTLSLSISVLVESDICEYLSHHWLTFLVPKEKLAKIVAAILADRGIILFKVNRGHDPQYSSQFVFGWLDSYLEEFRKNCNQQPPEIIFTRYGELSI